LEAAHIEIQDCYYRKTIKHDNLSVSISVPYQKYMHIKAYLATGYIPRAWREVKLMFIPTATGKVNYTQTKAYCPISLLSYMQKMMQKFETRKKRMKQWGISHTSIRICL
jgi:hypothetical protein